MKKLTALLIAAVMVFALAACGSSAEPAAQAAPAQQAAPAESAPAEEAAPAATEVSDANPVVNIGEFDNSVISGSVLLTSVGQSADSSMMEALLKKVGVEYTLNNTATADDLGAYGTVVVVAGASTKGLGAAGISTDDEMARAEALLAACKEAGKPVVMVHIGGESRRGSLSDQFTQVVMDNADYMVVVADGDKDGFFSNYAANGTPLTLVKSLANVVTPLSEVFG